MKVWIDLSNSPHPLFFAPIVRGLRDEGNDVFLTARDNAQTVELARARWPEAEVIGGESPPGRPAKAAVIARRVTALRRWARRTRPDVALSHNSYAQIVAARSLGVPAVTAMDFEHQPANHLAFRLAATILVPEVLAVPELARQGATSAKLVRYPGLKEELYIGDFEPDAEILATMGITPRPRTVVVARTPPTRATYHQFGNPLFVDAVRAVCSRSERVCIALVRHSEQRVALRELGLENCLVPETAVDSRSLIYAADAMIGAGGTMTREAALTGVPTWSLYAGQTPTVDASLERQGRLARLVDPRQLDDLEPRAHAPRDPAELRDRAAAILRVVLDATVATGNVSPRRGRGRGRWTV